MSSQVKPTPAKKAQVPPPRAPPVEEAEASGSEEEVDEDEGITVHAIHIHERFFHTLCALQLVHSMATQSQISIP